MYGNQRTSRINGGDPYVNTFELDESIYKDSQLNIKKFDSPTGEWAIFVLNNRDRKFQDKGSIESNQDNKYDLVVGPVADDDLTLLFRTFTRGLIDIETLIKEMRYKKFSNQYSFNSKESLKYLKSAGGN